MMIFTYYKLGIVVTDRNPIGRRVAGKYYKTFLAEKKRPEIRNKRPGILHHGVSILQANARPNIGAPVVAFGEIWMGTTQTPTAIAGYKSSRLWYIFKTHGTVCLTLIYHKKK